MLPILGETAAFTTALLVMLIGLIGVILPVLPGLLLVWLGALGFAIVEHFESIDPLTFAVLTLLTLAGVSADLWMTQLGARLGGATLKSQLFGLLGGVLGALLLALLGGVSAGIGMIVGSILGVLLAEYWRLGEWGCAARASGGWLLGWVSATVTQFLIGAVMIVIFVWQAFRG